MTQVLSLLLQESHRHDLYCLEIARRTGLGSGTVTAVLFRLEGLGWVTAKWEDEAEIKNRGRKPRRLYQMTSAGMAAARSVLTRKFPGATFPEGAPA
jgi:DNA-binding PadR family transcriptional regulator